MLLAASAAATSRPAYITAAVPGILGTAPRTFRQWAADHATTFTESPVRQADPYRSQAPGQGCHRPCPDTALALKQNGDASRSGAPSLSVGRTKNR